MIDKFKTSPTFVQSVYLTIFVETDLDKTDEHRVTAYIALA